MCVSDLLWSPNRLWSSNKYTSLTLSSALPRAAARSVPEHLHRLHRMSPPTRYGGEREVELSDWARERGKRVGERASERWRKQEARGRKGGEIIQEESGRKGEINKCCVT